MPCNCQSEMKKKFKEKLYPNATSIDGQYEILSGRAYMNYTVHEEGKKKPVEVPVLLSYCPHCGEPYDTSKPETE